MEKMKKYIIKATRALTRFQRFEPGSEWFRNFQNPKTANRTARFGSGKSRTGTETAGFGSVWNRVSSVRNQALPTLAGSEKFASIESARQILVKSNVQISPFPPTFDYCNQHPRGSSGSTLQQRVHRACACPSLVDTCIASILVPRRKSASLEFRLS